MENNIIQIKNLELLGRVFDGQATIEERNTVLCNMADAVFEEFFIVALRATMLFNEKVEVYETVQ